MSSYKDTLNLPKTEFPMKAGLTTREPEILARWESQKLYERIQEARKDATRTYVLHDGPPFANGDVHMGTALNKILKDFVVKSRTMAGYRAPMFRDGIVMVCRSSSRWSRSRRDLLPQKSGSVQRLTHEDLSKFRSGNSDDWGLGRLGESLPHPLAA